MEFAEVVYTSGFRIWVGSGEPLAEAIAVKNDRIIAVGTEAHINGFVGPSTKVIRGQDIRSGTDTEPLFIAPGFNDSHIHFLMAGHSLSAVQLREAPTREEMVKRVGEFARSQPPGRWIREGYWNHENWGGELPTHDWIDAVTPNNPVFVWRLDGHMGLANKLGLELAGIDKDTPNPPGGEIVKRKDGTPTGILKDNAMTLIHRVIPPPSKEEDDSALEAAMNFVLSHGVTSVQHMGTFEDLEVFRRAREANRLKTRIYAAVPIHQYEQLYQYIKEHGRGDEWLRWGNLKGFTDGSLGSHTALMWEPYDDDPPAEAGNHNHGGGHGDEDIGLMVNRPENLIEWTAKADKLGLQVSLHAIGDRAITIALDAFENAIKENSTADSRFRIEHAQHPRQADIFRFAKLKVIPSMQPYHLIDDGQWAEKVIGARRARTSFPFHQFSQLGVRMAFGSDWFVAPPIPLQGIYAAVTRSTMDNKRPEGWVPEEKATIEEALSAYTEGSAFASFEENLKGQLRPGMLADFVVLDRDLLELGKKTPHEIWNVNVLQTVVGGSVLFDRATAPKSLTSPAVIAM